MDLVSIYLAAQIAEPLVPLWVMEWSARALLALWLFAVGASVGSFLNVVVFRLPAGLNLVWPGSHCPRCGHAIRPRDNIPILGWLLLRGRCRDCQGPISPRYIAVETLVGLTFLGVAIGEYFLPRYLMTPVVGPQLRRLLTPFEPYPFWLAYVTHVVLATTLIGAALIEADRFRVPRRLFWPILAIGLFPPIIWPEIRRVPAGNWHAAEAWVQGLGDGLIGLAAGALLGAILALGWWAGSRGRGWPNFAPISLVAALGIVLGWQRIALLAPAIAAVLLIQVVLARVLTLSAVIPLAWFPALAAALWGTELFTAYDPAPGLAWNGLPALGATAATLALSVAAGAVAPPQYFAIREPERVVFPPVAKLGTVEQNVEQHLERHGDQQLIAESPPDATLPEATETPSSPPSEA